VVGTPVVGMRSESPMARVREEESREFYLPAPDDLGVPMVPDAPTLEDDDEKAQSFWARIAAVSAAVALALLAAEVLGSS
jgi:hypothetical protein